MGKRMDAAAKQEQFACTARRAKVAELYLKGTSQNKIAAELDVHPGTICRDIQILHRQLLDQQLLDIDALKQRELDRLALLEHKQDLLEETAWRAFERSCSKAVIEKAAEGKKGEVKFSKAERITEGRDGNPKWLQVIASVHATRIKIIAKRCELIGLNAPTKIANTDSQGNDILTVDQARQQYISVIAILRHRAGEGATGEGAGGAKRPDPGLLAE